MNRRDVLAASTTVIFASAMPLSAGAQGRFQEGFRDLLSSDVAIESIWYSFSTLRYALAVGNSSTPERAELSLLETQSQFEEMKRNLIDLTPKVRAIVSAMSDVEMALPSEYVAYVARAMAICDASGIRPDSTIGRRLAFSFESVLNIIRIAGRELVKPWVCDHYPLKYTCG